MRHGNKEWCKIWRGIDLSFQNWHEEFDKMQYIKTIFYNKTYPRLFI